MNGNHEQRQGRQAVFVGAYLWARAKAACFVIHEREDRT